MHSCLYEGWVWHRRRTPAVHQFRAALSLLYLDLDEVEQAFAGRWLWSANRANLAWFRREDHLGSPQTPLADAVRELLAQHDLASVRGPIRLLTQPRYLGYVNNPVSFYFCFAEDGDELQAVVAEVTNIPWGERYSYVLQPEEIAGSATRLPKRLHVSPFLPLDMEYGWRLSAPGEQLRIQISNFQHGRQVFAAALHLKRREWTTRALNRHLWRYPLQTYRVTAAIYWQALQLWWKSCPVYRHPDHSRSAATSAALDPASPRVS